MKTKKTIVVGLNEINFDFVKHYANQGLLPTFKKMFSDFALLTTTSESEYHLLEPWIQWVTVHTGKSYDEHKVYRLGDIIGRNDLPQIFEKYEDAGKSVAAISPFNAENRLSRSPFFVPDPWTQTDASGPELVKKLSKTVSQLVNNNASSKFEKKSIITLLQGVLSTTAIKDYSKYISLFLKRKLPGTKAIILDSILIGLFQSLWKKTKPDFSLLFLNSGAHIQHHYLFNSKAYKGEFKNPEWYCPEGYDPLIKILKTYDNALGELLKNDVNLFVITGLHQDPHDAMTYYWRLDNHKEFMNKIGCDYYTNVVPRMSRDFLIEFKNIEDSNKAETLLNTYFSKSDKLKIFNVDNRGNSLFVELIYENDIKDDFSIVSDSGNQVDQFKKYVSFVAIKNGKHNGIGYCLTNTEKENKQIKLSQVKDLIDNAVLN